MAPTEFQTESLSHTKRSRIHLDAATGWLEADKSQAALQSMLLGLHCRHWLSDNDANLLELMAPESTTPILKLDDQFLQSEGSTRLPLDTLPATPVNGTEAIFTQSWQPILPNEIGHCRVHNASLGLISGRNLTLCLIEPVRTSDGLTEADRFVALVALFRKALAKAGKAFDRLKAKHPNTSDYLLVNRASGRVIAAGDKICQVLGMNNRSVVGLEYSVIGKSMTALAVNRGVLFENLSIEDMHLAVASILPEKQRGTVSTEDRFFSEFFIHDMRNKLSAITTASSHLETLAEGRGLEEESELAAIVQDQATELDHHIERLRLFVEYDKLPVNLISIGKEAGDTVELLAKQHDLEIQLERNETETFIQAPLSALSTLIEAAVFSQSSPNRAAVPTIIAHTHGQSSTTLRLTTPSESGHRSARFNERWKTFAARLAEIMGIDCRQTHLDDGSLTTTLIIPTEEKQ